MPDPIVPVVENPIDVPPSEDNGNIPVDAPEEGGNGVPPVVPPNPVEPVVPPTEPPVAPTAELYELPDGRKVDAATLTKEWKENFLPEFTRKSQALAAKERTGDPNIKNPPTSPFADPNYVPQSYEELAKAIRESTLAELEAKEQAIKDERRAIEDAVSGQLNELKATDPNLNENALFLHATKYKFPDLKAAYQNMKDMAELAKNVKQTTANEIRKRNDPVSVSPGATGASINPSNFGSAIEYFRALGK